MGHVALSGARVTTSLYALSLHASEFEIGSLVALFALLPMLFAVPMGRLMDRIGMVKPMIAGCTLMCIGCGVPSLFDGLPVLYLAVVLIGTGFMGIHVGSQHAVGAMSAAGARSGNFSLLAMGYSISSFLGPVIAGFIIDHARYSIAYAVFCGFAIVALALVTTSKSVPVVVTKRAEHTASGSLLDLLRDPEMRRIYIVGILLGSAWDLFTFVMPIHGTKLGFSASTIGLVLGSLSCATFVVRLAMGWISRRYTEWQILASALTVTVISYVLLPLMKDPAAIIAVTIMLGFGLGSAQPNVLALLHHASPPGRAGEAVGMRVTISNACQVFLPLAFGAAGATLGLFAVFWGMGAMIGCGVPTAWRRASNMKGST